MKSTFYNLAAFWVLGFGALLIGWSRGKCRVSDVAIGGVVLWGFVVLSLIIEYFGG